jgi:serine/threonine-protein kinase
MESSSHASLAERLADILTGSYELEGEIGRGGMGIVYSARDVKLKRRVAIKVLPPELAYREEIRKRFTREAQTAARLSHPHIVPIHSVGEEGGLVWFVMGFVDGESLAARLRRRDRLPVEEARRIMKETADALGLAHNLGIIHRDIKPDNILLEGTRRRVMVTDFGIAKALTADGSGASLTGTGVAIGTPAYMSPEQAAGDREVDARSDIYALGVVAFEMLTGEIPFKAPTVQGILVKQVTEPVPELRGLRHDCPDELASSVMRCLDKEPDNRWSTIDALRRALESRSSTPYRPRSAMSRRPSAPSRPGRQRDQDWWEWFGDEPRSDRQPGRHRDRGARPARPAPPARRPDREPAESNKSGEPGVVRKFRQNLASYVSVNGGLLLMNVVTGLDSPWFLFPAIGWGIGLASQYGKLWGSGYSMRDVLNRPPAPDALPPTSQKGGGQRQLASAKRPEPTTGEFGPFADQIGQVRKDRQAIMQVLEKLTPSDRAMLPEVTDTVEALVARAEELALMLRQMEGAGDDSVLARLDARIEEVEAQGGGGESDRRLDLLRRQRATVIELVERRQRVSRHLESCVLAVQNVRFDLLRLRSAGVQAVLGDLTSATQEARALQIDVEAAMDAAGEIREALRGPRDA